MLALPNREIILASMSAARKTLLESVALRFTIAPASVDEAALIEAGKAQRIASRDMATVLAEAKAMQVSLTHPQALVIACDQLLECAGAWFSKPQSREEARQTLESLGGRTHQLITAVVAFQAGSRLWHHCASPKIVMRDLDAAAISHYLDMIGEAAYQTPGAYKIEHMGGWILSQIDGCPYAVQGLPLLALLDFLRGLGLSPTPKNILSVK